MAPVLRARGHSLLLVDDLSGPVSAVHPDAPVMRMDIREPATLSAFRTCDVILHLAASSGVMACAQDPAGTQAVNVEATRRLGDWAHAHKVSIAFASSFAVVGVREMLPITESTPTKPTHEYARQKAEGERILKTLTKHGPGGAILRMSNVYGRYQVGDRVIAKGNVLNLFAEQAKSGVLKVFAPGTQRRDFIHLDDVVAHWVAVAEQLGESRRRKEVPIYNVASGESRSVLSLAEQFAKEWERRVPGGDPLSVEVVTNPRGAVELLQDEFEVSRAWTERSLGVRCRRTLASTMPELILRAAAQ